jgi:hypothetical protein
MDLDALGLNSTFESTELQGSYEPAVDRVDTSEIEGPEDFTMNMTYWMTADLPLAQIKSRKEAKGRIQEHRMDAMQEEYTAPNSTGEGDQVVVAERTRDRQEGRSAHTSPTRRANGTTDERAYSTPASERSMENDEKVRSFLSALPDTDMESAIAGTPLHLPKHSFLQIPRSSPPKARSLQPTVEDYDTPRKPTQETVIHHTSAVIDTSEHDALQQQIAELHSRLGRQELTSQKRITELETILSYTRSELDGARNDYYNQRETAARLETKLEEQTAEAETQLKAREDALEAKMHEYGEEMRLQTRAKLQKQRDDYEQSRALADSERMAKEQAQAKSAALMAESTRSTEKQLQAKNDQQQAAHEKSAETVELTSQLSAVQARADHLQAQLKQATADAASTLNWVEREKRSRIAQIFKLETSLQSTNFELECARADVAAKEQLFRTNGDLNAHIRALRSDLDTARSELTTRDLHGSQDVELTTRISSLQSQLESSRAEVLSKEQDLSRHTKLQDQLEQRLNAAQGRTEGLETTITTLRQQLAEAHRDSARAQTDRERFERDLEDANDRLTETRTETDRRIHDLEQKLSRFRESKLEAERKFKDLQSQHEDLVEGHESALEEAHAEAQRRVTDVEQKLTRVKESKLEAERKLRELQSQRDDLVEGHEAMMEDVRDKAEDAVRKAGALLEQERNEKKRLIKDLKRTKDDLEKLRAEAAQRLVDDDEESDHDSATSALSATTKAKDIEITTLRDIIRKQVLEMKTLKTETNTLRKESKKLKVTAELQSEFESTISELKDQLGALSAENATLQLKLEDQEAINTAMDEKLATLLNRVMKERAKTVVGKRDGQWQESVDQVQNEKALLGRVLLRQWGREELGIADEKGGEKQTYKYQYVKRERA